jgi:hypothetical protein
VLVNTTRSCSLIINNDFLLLDNRLSCVG